MGTMLSLSHPPELYLRSVESVLFATQKREGNILMLPLPSVSHALQEELSKVYITQLSSFVLHFLLEAIAQARRKHIRSGTATGLRSLGSAHIAFYDHE